jgi:hypothetical protein
MPQKHNSGRDSDPDGRRCAEFLIFGHEKFGNREGNIQVPESSIPYSPSPISTIAISDLREISRGSVALGGESALVQYSPAGELASRARPEVTQTPSAFSTIDSTIYSGFEKK